jgi:hypothetical protein
MIDPGHAPRVGGDVRTVLSRSLDGETVGLCASGDRQGRTEVRHSWAIPNRS